jgi:hypothetical protein
MKKGWLDKYIEIADGGTTISGPTILSRQKYNQKNITPKQALTQEALQYIFGNPSENYNPQPIEQVPNDATNRQPYISKQQAEQISKDVRNPYYGSPNYHVPVKEYSISPDKQENKMDNELAERIKKEEEKHTQWDRIHYGSKTAINLANMFTAGTMPPLAYSAGAMDAWDAGMDYSEGNYTGAMNNATGALLNILPQTLGLNTRSFTPSTNSYATARWWKNNPSALVAPTTITPNLIDYANRGLGLSTQYVNPALNAFVNNKLNIRGVQTPITGKLASDIGLSVDDAYKTIHKNGGEVNYNNSNVSLPEGFVGMGNDTSGRNYSPAWGGQFQNGGWLSKYISEDKFLQPNSEKLPTGYKIPNRDPSSELAMSIGGEDGEPAYLIPSFKYGQPLEDPLKEYRETGDYLGGPFKTWQEADDWDINVRHPYVEKNQAIPFPIRTKGKDMQMGGVLPSAFVRTGDIPSEGKYAKKTMPSAQTGLISHPGGNRNINTNQVTISPRQEYENIQAEKKKQSELFNYIQKNNEIQKARSDIYTDPQTGKQVIQNIGIQPSASPIDAAVLGVGALYSGGMGLLGSMANMLSPVPLPSKNILSNIYKRFPLTNNAKIKLIEEQDKAFQTANAFTEAWATHPVTKEKINNILNTRKGNYIQHDLDTPFYNYNNVLVDTKNYNPYDFPGDVADLLNKGERKFAGFNNPQGYSVTLRNGIIGKVPAKKIGEIAVHEGGHTMQHMGGDPANYYHGGWNNEITAYNPKTNYYSANLDTDLGRYFGKNMKTPNKFDSWEASPNELHADLMKARFKANITPDTELTDKVVDNLIKQGNLNKFFKYGVSKNIKRDMIRMLPVVTGVALLKNKPQDESSYASGGQIKTDNRGYWNPKNWGHPVRINSNDITMEGVDQPLWGISDTGDTKYMEPGQDYRFKGKSVTEYPMAQNGLVSTSDKEILYDDRSLSPKDFTLKYISSPKYKERLSKWAYTDINNTIKDRTKDVQNTKVYYQNESPNVAQQLKNDLKGIPYSTMGSTAFFPGKIIIDKKQVKELATTSDDVLAHEFAHKELMSGFAPYGKGLDTEDSYQILTHMKPVGRYTEHDLIPSENKADLNAARYELYKQGVDVFKKDFTKEDLNLLKTSKNFTVKRLFKNYEDKDIIWLMNNIAQNKQTSSDVPLALNGINNLDEKTTEHLDQLTNFTNYNKPTVGGWLSKYSQS